MNLVYNSDSYAVVQIELADEAEGSDATTGTGEPAAAAEVAHALAGSAAAPAPDDAAPPASSRGGYEIVDKFARKGVFLGGDVALSFRAGVEALSGGSPTADEIDDYIAGFTVLAQQPVVLH